MERDTTRKLHRSNRDKMLAGVAAGLGEYFDIDPTIVRLAFVLTAFAGGTGLIAYIVLAIIMPLEGSEGAHPRDIVRENISDIERSARELGETFSDEAPISSAEVEERKAQRRRTAGIILIALGVLFLLSNLNVFVWWMTWDRLWPLVLVAIGIAILMGRGRR